jgi:SAM-dependent methyltransferase
VICPACGSATTDPPPDDEELERAYAGWYRPASGRFAGPGDRLLARSRGALARRIDGIAPAGAVLDVGSGDGTLLRALRARGREAVGLEREGTGDGVRADDVRADDVRDVGGRWSAIVFWHSLEHLRDAGGALAYAAGLLAERGVVVIAMPNAGSLQARAFGERWLALDLPRHLVHVPAPALISRLEQLGLRIERVSFARGGQVVFGWLRGLVGLLPGRPDLYDALRRPEARRRSLSARGRATTLLAGIVLAPVAAAAGAVEIAARRGGSVYVEARRP